MKYSKRTAAILVCVFLTFVSLATAQLNTGVISGIVTDQSGAVIPGVAITIKNVETAVSRELVTNEAGRYSAEALPVGTYDVTGALTGFQTIRRSGIVLTVGRNLVIDMSLQVGDIAQAVTVEGDVSQVETTTATVSNLIDEKRVLEIPLNNRDLTQLAYFTPGVLRVPLVTNPATQSGASAGGLGDKLSVNGARDGQNAYILNGIPNSDVSGNAQGASGAYSGAETIKEFQVITNAYSAEYPSVAGAIVTAVTKSGTNAFHGSLFEFLRNDNLDAAKWEDNAFGRKKPEFKRNQFGGSLGGPILKNKTFFFASYEGLRERRSTTTTFTTITAGPRNGSFGPISPVVRPYLDLWPLPGEAGTTLITDFGDGRALVAGTNQRPVTSDFGSFKLDHQFASQRTGMIAFNYSRDESKVENLNALVASGANIGLRSRTELMSVQHTSILSSSTINEFVAGFSRTKPIGNIPIARSDYSKLFFGPEAGQMGAISIANITGIGWVDNATSPGRNTLTFKENMSLTRGRHTIKFGGQLQAFRDHLETITSDGNGAYTFTSLQNFLQAKPQTLTMNVPRGAVVLGMKVLQDPIFNLRQYGIASYFQENYAATPSFTLNAGLRYEFLTNPKETRGHLNSLRTFFNEQIIDGQLYRNPTLKNFSPRLGFAWSPKSGLSIRAGGGIYYEPPSLFAVQFNLQGVLPYGVSGAARDNASSGALHFPDAFTTQPEVLATTPQARLMEYDMKSATVYRWSLTLEKEFGAWLTSASYTGSRGVHLLQQYEGNASRWDGFPNPVPTLEKNFRVANGNINPAFSRITVQAPRGSAHYHGLTVNVRRRLVGGLQFQSAYSLSKNIDNGAGAVNLQGSLAQGIRTIYYWDVNMTKGRSLLDIRNNFVTNFVYDLPKFDVSGFADRIANGWQVSGVLTLSDGFPFDINDTNTAQQTEIFASGGLRPNLIAGGNNNPVLGGPNLYYDPNQFVPSTCTGSRLCRPGDPDYHVGHLGNLGYNTLTGPGLATLDFSVLKNINVSENKGFQFRTEVFNLTNRPNFFIPDSTPFLSNGTRDSQAGRITETRTSARQIQFALKYIF